PSQSTTPSMPWACRFNAQLRRRPSNCISRLDHSGYRWLVDTHELIFVALVGQGAVKRARARLSPRAGAGYHGSGGFSGWERNWWINVSCAEVGRRGERTGGQHGSV